MHPSAAASLQSSLADDDVQAKSEAQQTNRTPLSPTEERFERHRYLEVYKLRNTAHLKGRHNLVIDDGDPPGRTRALGGHADLMVGRPAAPPRTTWSCSVVTSKLVSSSVGAALRIRMRS